MTSERGLTMNRLHIDYVRLPAGYQPQVTMRASRKWGDMTVVWSGNVCDSVMTALNAARAQRDRMVLSPGWPKIAIQVNY
jgi:hypothetical protein